MNVSDLVSFLKDRVSLCEDFSNERLVEVAFGGVLKSFDPGETVIRYGDDARN